MFTIIIPKGTYFGTVEKINGNVITISKETWAPGLWAGEEDTEFKISDIVVKVKSIDLFNRLVTVYDSIGITVGSNFYLNR